MKLNRKTYMYTLLKHYHYTVYKYKRNVNLLYDECQYLVDKVFLYSHFWNFGFSQRQRPPPSSDPPPDFDNIHGWMSSAGGKHLCLWPWVLTDSQRLSCRENITLDIEVTKIMDYKKNKHQYKLKILPMIKFHIFLKITKQVSHNDNIEQKLLYVVETYFPTSLKINFKTQQNKRYTNILRYHNCTSTIRNSSVEDVSS